MRKTIMLGIMLSVSLSICAQTTGTYTDSRDDKVYKTVTIGTQTWMAENLAYKAKKGCWAYNDDVKNVATYGYLYNLETSKKACPKGWNLPNYAEWNTMINYLGGASAAGGKMKSETGWKDSGNGTNTSSFSALPGGDRSSDGNFGSLGCFAYWWISSEVERNDDWFNYLYYDNSIVSSSFYNTATGFSVRCIKENSDKGTELTKTNEINVVSTKQENTPIKISTGEFTDVRDNKVYKTVTIGTQTWMAENLAYKADNGCWTFQDEGYSDHGAKYWYYYNWEAAKAACPAGWHLPSDAEWNTLINYLGGEIVAGGKLKEKKYWGIFEASNESGFSALAGGYYKGNIYALGSYGFWWSGTEDNTLDAWSRRMYNGNSQVYRLSTSKENGNSVRCIKD